MVITTKRPTPYHALKRSRPVQIGFETKENYSRIKPIGNGREYAKNEKKIKIPLHPSSGSGGREVLRVKIGLSQFWAKLQVL